jgi:hypothetical protein
MRATTIRNDLDVELIPLLNNRPAGNQTVVDTAGRDPPPEPVRLNKPRRAGRRIPENPPSWRADQRDW